MQLTLLNLIFWRLSLTAWKKTSRRNTMMKSAELERDSLSYFLNWTKMFFSSYSRIWSAVRYIHWLKATRKFFPNLQRIHISILWRLRPTLSSSYNSLYLLPRILWRGCILSEAKVQPQILLPLKRDWHLRNSPVKIFKNV